MVKERTWEVLILIGLVNFHLFWWAGAFLGGDALSGCVQGHRYYLASHGHLTEVSRGVWTYSLVHTLTNLITLPVAFVAALSAAIRRIRVGSWSNRGRGAV